MSAYKRISPTPVIEGGTGAQTLTIHGVLIGEGTGAIVSTTPGTTGQVLTGVTGSDPVFSAPAASSISITGNTGGALTGASFTFTGGTTGLSFGGSGTTETLTFAGITANGGTVSLATDATTSTINVGTGAGVKTCTFGSTNTTSATTVQSGSGSIINNTGLTIDSTGRAFNTKQPAFSAYLTDTINNQTGDGTVYTIAWNAERFDQGNNFTGSTFTAPVTGKYMLSVYADIVGLGAAHTQYEVAIVTTAVTYNVDRGNPFVQVVGGGNQYTAGGSVLADMTAGDTATTTLTVYNSTKTVGVASSGNSSFSAFTGCLIC